MDLFLTEAIAYLQDLQKTRGEGGAADFWQGLAFVFAPMGAVILAVWGATRWNAGRRYRGGIAKQAQDRQTLEDERTLRRDAEKEVVRLAALRDALKEAGPDGFMRRADLEERDGNPGRVAKEARAFLDGQSPALRRAFTALARNEVTEGMEEGHPDFETAQLYATAALSLDPQDRMARMYAEDLAYAKDMAVKGVTVTLADNAGDRLDAQDHAAMSIERVEQYFFAAREAGRYRLMLDIAEHGETLAHRTFGKTARPTLKFRRHQAEALLCIGQPAIALDQLKTLRASFEAAFEPDNFETLYMWHLIACCLQDAGLAAEALEKGEEALTDAMRVLVTDHPHTMVVRYLIVSCLQDTGRLAEALKKGEVLLTDQIRVLDADHPHTLTTRYLIASCLQATGRVAEALEKGEALLSDRMRVLGVDHPNTLATRYLIASCLRDTGRVAEALEKGEALLTDRVRVSGADHTSTLATRSLIASCLRDTGRVAEALEKGEALLTDRVRVSGADHPRTLTTRSLIALCLLDLDRPQEARERHEGVIEGLRAAGITGDESRYMKRALEAESRLAAGET